MPPKKRMRLSSNKTQRRKEREAYRQKRHITEDEIQRRRNRETERAANKRDLKRRQALEAEINGMFGKVKEPDQTDSCINNAKKGVWICKVCVACFSSSEKIKIHCFKHLALQLNSSRYMVSGWYLELAALVMDFEPKHFLENSQPTALTDDLPLQNSTSVISSRDKGNFDSENSKTSDDYIGENNNQKRSAPLYCVCGQACYSLNQYLDHLYSHRRKKKWQCLACSEVFKKMCDLKMHRYHVHTTKPLCSHTAKPCLCHKAIPSRSQKANLAHVRVATTPVKQWLCEVCGKLFSVNQFLVWHQRTHSDTKPSTYVCSYCPKGFWDLARLKVHLRVHTKEKPYPCTTCNKCFSTVSGLNVHMRVHTGEEPYSCVLCKKKFKYVSSLINHRRVYHTNEKPFVCEFCGKRMHDASALTNHRRIHTKERPYICEICEKKFRCHGTLQTHRRIHTKEKPWSCDVCGKSVNHKSNLTKHLQVHKRTSS